MSTAADPNRPMSNIKILVAYEGTRYLGWQKTKEGPSIEETLEQALFQIYHLPFSLQAASRTDAGVHAEGQTVNFFLHEPPNLYKLQRGLNALLPKDICVKHIEIAKPTFHPTLDAFGKEYCYAVCNDSVQLPFYRHFSWRVPLPLDLKRMEKAASYLIGELDFSAFSNLKVENAVRKVTEIEIQTLPDKRFLFSIKGNHFLYKMVRNLIGTLVYIGCGKLDPESIPDILASKDRTRAGPTAPAHGLILKTVFYSNPMIQS